MMPGQKQRQQENKWLVHYDTISYVIGPRQKQRQQHYFRLILLFKFHLFAVCLELMLHYQHYVSLPKKTLLNENIMSGFKQRQLIT